MGLYKQALSFNEFVSDPQVVGAGIGTVSGALIGSLLAGKGKRGKGALIGSLLGLGPGWYIGRQHGQLAKAEDAAVNAKNEAASARNLADKVEREKRALDDDLDMLKSTVYTYDDFTPDESKTIEDLLYGEDSILSKIDGMKKLRDRVRSIE